MIFKLKNIAFGEFIWIVSHCLIDFFGLNTIQFRHVSVNDHLLSAQGDHFVW